MDCIVEACAEAQRPYGCSAIAAAEAGLLRGSGDEAFPRASVPVVEYRNGTACQKVRDAICERELRLMVNGEPLVSLLCSDASLRELAYGFLYSEGIIGSLADVGSFSIDRRSMEASFGVHSSVCTPACPTISSGFGGKALVAFSSELPRSSVRMPRKCVFTMEDLTRAVSAMCSFSREYAITRGIHRSALFHRGVPLASFEDIGRHNTFDKLAGRCLLEGFGAEGALLATTGRISSEMVRKALRLGVSGIASLSGPTDKAIAIAQNAGMLLAGYVTETSSYVYAGM